MIIGDTGRFAIEFELDILKLADSNLAKWLYGRVRWWCGGKAVGVFESDTVIADVASEATRFLAHNGNRRDAFLSAAPNRVVVDTIVRALFEDHGQSDEPVEADDQRYRRFLVKPQVDVFDSWDIFLVEGEQIARLIWRRVTELEVDEVPLVPGEFDGVLKRFLAALPGPTTAKGSLR